MLNSVNLQGRLTDTPVPQLTKSGTYVLNFCIAVEEMITSKNEKKVHFFKCVAWGKTADFISRNFCKGKEIIIVGRLDTNEYSDKNGVNHKDVFTVVEKVNFCGIPIDSAEKDDWFLGSKTPPEPIK